MKHKVIFELEDGFYFWDEAGLESGPYKTLELAQKAFDAHIKWLNHDHQENSIRKIRDKYDEGL